MATTAKPVKIPAGQTMAISAQATGHVKSTDASAIPFFKAKHAMPASINTIMTRIAPPAIKATAYSISAPHALLVETLRRHVKSASTATLRIPTTIVLPLDAPSAKKIISGLHQIH